MNPEIQALSIPERKYIPALDGLRALAALSVIAFHMEGSLGTLPIFQKIAQAGWIGVDVFFVLSGFLITRILLQEWESTGKVRIGRFYYKRALRLVPGYLIFVALTWAVISGVGDDVQRNQFMQAVPFLLTYTSNFAAASHVEFPISLHAWSLAIEEQFYLLFPLAFGTSFTIRRMTRHLAAAIVGIAAIRWIGAYYWPFEWPSIDRLNADIYFLTPFRIDSILVGCLLAMVIRRPKAQATLAAIFNSEWSWLVIWASWITAAVAFGPKNTGDPVYRFGLPILYLLTALVIAGLYLERPSRIVQVLTLRPFVQIGRISYGVYLLHVLVINAFEELLSGLPAMTYALVAPPFVTAAIVLAAGIQYRVVEMPFLRLKQRV